MVKVGLQFSAVLEFVSDLRPSGSDFLWFLKLKCGSCGETRDHFQTVSQEEQAPLKGGRGHANMVTKCKMCGRESSIDIIKDSIQAYNMDDNPGFKTIIIFDCRGMEPVDFAPNTGWVAKGVKIDEEDNSVVDSGTVFDDVDLTDLEWSDYDEKSNEAPTITEIKWKFIKVK